MSLTTELLQPEITELLREGKYRELRDSLRGLEAHDLAELLDAAEPAEAVVLFRLLPRDRAGDAFAELDADDQQRLLEEFGDERALRIIESMEPDDRVALLDEMPPEVARRLILALSPKNRRVTQQILGYPAESVGRLMTPEYVRLRAEWTVARALEHIRRYGKDAETVHWVFIVDARGRLLDDLHIRKLLLADPDDTIQSLMDDKFLSVDAHADQEEAVALMNDYDRTALPVIDPTGVLLGIITYDDIADIAELEATEDIHKLGGVEALDLPYMQTGLVDMLRKRGIWLAVLFVVQVLTIGIMSAFDEQLEKAVILAVFVPLIISAGGNTGTQAASLLVRALALREIEPGAWKSVLRRELVTGLCLGAALGLLGFLVVTILHLTGIATHHEHWRIGLAVGCAVTGIVTWAALVGSGFPLLLDKLKLDPATISSPLVATIMDVSGIVIYFIVAVSILTGTVL